MQTCSLGKVRPWFRYPVMMTEQITPLFLRYPFALAMCPYYFLIARIPGFVDLIHLGIVFQGVSGHGGLNSINNPFWKS